MAPMKLWVLRGHLWSEVSLIMWTQIATDVGIYILYWLSYCGITAAHFFVVLTYGPCTDNFQVCVISEWVREYFKLSCIESLIVVLQVHCVKLHNMSYPTNLLSLLLFGLLYCEHIIWLAGHGSWHTSETSSIECRCYGGRAVGVCCAILLVEEQFYMYIYVY